MGWHDLLLISLALAQGDSLWKSSVTHEDINHQSLLMSLGAKRCSVPVQRGDINLLGKPPQYWENPKWPGPASPAGDIQVTIFVNIAWTLASQFKSHRGQVLGSGFHDDSSNCRAPSIEDVVEPLLQELRGFFNTPVNNNIQVLKEEKTKNTCTAKLIWPTNMSSFFNINM